LLLWSTSHGVVNMAYMHENAQHFKLLDHLGIDLETMFAGYMKLIGNGIKAQPENNSDSESFFRNSINAEA